MKYFKHTKRVDNEMNVSIPSNPGEKIVLHMQLRPQDNSHRCHCLLCSPSINNTCLRQYYHPELGESFIEFNPKLELP